MHLRPPLSLALILVAIATTQPAHAGDPRVALFGTVGFSGESEAELDLTRSGLESDADLKQTLGVGVSFDNGLHRHFALGGLFRLYSWGAENYSWETNGDNGGVGFDASLLPRLRFPLSHLEIYGALPIGLSAASKEDNRVMGEVEYDLGFGYNVGIFAGIQIPVSQSLAIFGEFGRQYRKIDNDGLLKNSNVDGAIVISTSQWAANIGVVFL